MEEVRGLDPALDALTAVLTQWHEVIGTERVSCREIIDRATAQQTPTVATRSYSRAEFVYPDFREALLTVAGDGGVVNGRRLGRWLAAHQNHIVQGLMLTRCSLHRGISTWQVESVLASESAQCCARAGLWRGGFGGFRGVVLPHAGEVSDRHVSVCMCIDSFRVWVGRNPPNPPRGAAGARPTPDKRRQRRPCPPTKRQPSQRRVVHRNHGALLH
ncbi:MAG TPA: hypothetical protein VE684_05465 [Crenalkalicoccus sp.]|jgi:hypothetical protein|nr:hypothetical protein [Crenalkalicoccus sp.]